ncbi:DNA ligase [Shewanella sp. NIFS-20-20]|uniref:DNA ligase n=1 Tax=Shewanella sp. NIFS-20-20 TaxID=2853806 RepID=UPI001C44C690|nr:DNA ligase [Shewanella sp. NIFS-20-20]MBV7314349.1 DNA ligase [Shewanella sp. NIFS-20-20]
MKNLIKLVLVLCCFCANTEPMSQLQLAGSAYKNVDIRLYLVSEKLDGVRGYWDGQQMWSKQGHMINLPAEFTAGFPNIVLDGELWAGRGQFEQVLSIVLSQQPSMEQLTHLRYMVFDTPALQVPFSERYHWAQQYLVGLTPNLQLVEQVRLDSHAELQQHLSAVMAKGGEGLMLHLASALYSPGNRDVLIKVKPYMDAEATVIGYVAGKGAFTGKMGSIKVRTPEGLEFAIGTGFSLDERVNPPPIGSIITYRYQGVTAKGVPRFASFIRMKSSI